MGVLNGQVKNTFDNSNLFGIQANITDLTPEQLLENKKVIIAENGVTEEEAKLSPDPDICIEMETGTGKTLVYLRTAYELHKEYQLTKFIILVPSIAIKEGVLESVFRIFHIYNTGATFGLFSGGGTIFRYVAILVSLGIIYYNFVLPGNQWLLRLALGLQMGGALGNMIDRFRIGHVTDFIDIGPWYIFNLADLSIVSGAVILGLLVFQESRELKARHKAAEAKENHREEPSLATAVPP